MFGYTRADVLTSLTLYDGSGNAAIILDPVGLYYLTVYGYMQAMKGDFISDADNHTPLSVFANSMTQSAPLFRAIDGSGNIALRIGPTGAVGEHGINPPNDRPVISGTLTAATLAQLTSIVSQLVTALANKGTVDNTTT